MVWLVTGKSLLSQNNNNKKQKNIMLPSMLLALTNVHLVLSGFGENLVTWFIPLQRK
jgi:hypothetical protein